MAKSLPIVGDQNPGSVAEELRRQFNHLLLVLENVAVAVDAGDMTADEAFTVLATTLAAGSDASITGVDGGANNYAGTGLEVVGIKSSPALPKFPRRSLGNMASSDKDL